MLPYTMWNASPAQVEPFKTLPSKIQGYVLNGKYPRALEDDTYGKTCKLNSWKCVYKLSLVGFFRYPGCLEELPHYREHGMCSKCKQRKLARRPGAKSASTGLPASSMHGVLTISKALTKTVFGVVSMPCTKSAKIEKTTSCSATHPSTKKLWRKNGIA